jgi:hypothetical protein
MLLIYRLPYEAINNSLLVPFLKSSEFSQFTPSHLLLLSRFYLEEPDKVTQPNPD